MPTETLASVDENGVAPARRIKSPKTLIGIHERFLQNDEKASQIRAVAQALIDGALPYDEQKLIEEGLEDKVNNNFGEAEAEMSSALAPYTDIINNVPRVADIRLNNPDAQEGIEKSERVSKHWDWMLKKWDAFFQEMQRLAVNFIRDGAAITLFRDERTWKWEPYAIGDWLTDRNTPAEESRMEVITVHREFTPSRLYAYIRDEKAAAAVGWNVKMVRKAIWKASKDTSKWKSESSHWTDFQRRVKEHDIGTDDDYNKVSIIYGIVQEFDGKTSVLIASESCAEDFLCARWSKYEDIGRALVLFTYGVGTHGTIHTIRGLAHKIYNSIAMSNRILSEMLESVMAEGRSVIKGTPQAIQDFQFVRVGNFTMIDQSFEPVQLTPTNTAARMQPAYAMMQQLRQNNTGSYASRSITPDNQARSATEVKAQMMNESALSSAAMALFYSPYDRLMREMYRRAVSGELSDKDDGGKLAKEFIERCRIDGISIDELRNFQSVRAVRSIGNGSPAMREQAANRLLELSSGFDEVGKRNALRIVVAATEGVGYQSVDAFVPRDEPRQTIDHQIANMENTLFKLGQPATVTGEQNHVAHLSAHFPFIQSIIEAIKAQQLPPEQALTMLRPSVENATEHVLRLSENALRQIEAGEMRKRLQNVSAFVNQLDQQVTEQMLKAQREAEGQAGEQPDPKQMFELQKAQLKVQEQTERSRANREMHDQKMEQIRANMALTDLKAARTMAVDSAKNAVGRPTLVG
jgi:hypothetical protein